MKLRNTQLLSKSGNAQRESAAAKSQPVALLAVNDKTEAATLRPILERWNFEVLEAGRGHEAVALAIKRSVRLVVASLDLAGMTGYEFWQKLREDRGTDAISFLFITHQGVKPEKLVPHETFVGDYLQRPLDVVDFEKRLRGVLGFASPAAKGEETASVEQPPSSAPPPPSTSRSRGAGGGAVTPPASSVSAIYEEAAIFVLASIRRAETGKPIDAERGMDIAGRILEGPDREKGLLRLSMDRLPDFALRESAVNVAILASQIARTLHFAPKRIARLVLAGMLHGIGSAKLPKDLLFKGGAFTDAERMVVERVPEHSARILSNIPGFEWLPQMVARFHGSGEPERAEASGDFAEDAQVMSLSIVFEACIHKRPDREAMTGHQALEELISHKYGFSNKIVKGMIKTLSVYPYSEFVVLNTGEIAQVVDIHRENPMRPTVRVLFTVDRKPYTEHRTIDLAQNSSVHIARAITWKELTSMVKTPAGS